MNLTESGCLVMRESSFSAHFTFVPRILSRSLTLSLHLAVHSLHIFGVKIHAIINDNDVENS